MVCGVGTGVRFPPSALLSAPILPRDALCTSSLFGVSNPFEKVVSLSLLALPSSLSSSPVVELCLALADRLAPVDLLFWIV